MTNKEKIKREALFLFAEKGFDKASVRDIAKRVGIRESAIYNHYKSKNEIFHSLVSDAKNRLIAARFVDEKLLDQLNEPEIFFENLTKRIIDAWSETEDKAYTKLLIQAKFNSSIECDFKLEDLFSNLKKLLEIIFEQLKNYGFVKNLPTEFLVNEYLSPLIVLKLSFLINNFFDRNLVLNRAMTFTKLFWNQIKK